MTGKKKKFLGSTRHPVAVIGDHGTTDSTRLWRGHELRNKAMRTRNFRGARPVVGAGAALAALIIGAGTAGAQANPPGNNGTVKIDGVAFDDHPDNEPHPGCSFQVDFYGFDEGDLVADVTFEAIDPTGQADPLLTDTVPIGEDDNAGGGSEEGLDASETYDLTEALAGITPHPQQGWHVKLTVHAEGSQGADTKHKVFWVTDCGTEDPPTSSSSTTAPTTSTTVKITPGSSTTTVEITPGSSTTVAPGGGDDAPGGPSGPQSPEPAVDIDPTSSSGDLPVTGSNTLGLVVLAVGMLGVGSAVVVATRRFRTTDS